MQVPNSQLRFHHLTVRVFALIAVSLGSTALPTIRSVALSATFTPTTPVQHSHPTIPLLSDPPSCNLASHRSHHEPATAPGKPRTCVAAIFTANVELGQSVPASARIRLPRPVV
ncbi:hypothetical protein IG631_07242 [Alternaria alternata]|nr:hypothetical protein IG631_07242 [Alternaria alternata]